MVTMAEPWRHPETGMYYLRRQIPKRLRDEFGGKQLWKRSLDTKDAAEARRAFTTLNAELERLFGVARAAVTDRAARTILTPDLAADAVVWISAARVGSRLDRFPALANVFFAEEAASILLGGAPVATFLDPTAGGIAGMDPAFLPGDLWLRVVRTRSRADALWMAEHMIIWVHGGFRNGSGRFDDLARSPENDVLIMDAVTAAIEREQADLRLLIASPFRPTGTRLFSCYEAFVHIVDSMVNQHAKWLKVTRKIPWRKPIASLNYLLTSHVWRQDHNGLSHQDPGFIDHVANKTADVARIYLPPDANCLLSVADHCLRSRGYVNVVVAGKQPEWQWLGIDAAVRHCTTGAGIWECAAMELSGLRSLDRANGNKDITLGASARPRACIR